MTPRHVYLVQDNSASRHPGKESPVHSRIPYWPYWEHLYFSAEEARAGVEYWAKRGGRGPLRWEESFGVQTAYPAGPDGGEWLYKVVPHLVHEPED